MSAELLGVTVEPFADVFRVQYHKPGELVASFCWCDTMDEVRALLASLGITDMEVTQ